ncbi:MAG: acetyl-CoA carboxylase biotin carboxyl carrier protein subunit [Chitinophagaceae bacterium]
MTDAGKTYKVKVNGLIFSLTEKEISDANLVQTASNRFNLLKDNRSINALVSKTGAGGKNLLIEAEGELFEIEIQDELDQLLEQMGYNSVTNKHIKEIKAPMPGLVLEIAVKDGQEVNDGDKIIILEAMKMENSILIHTQARIKKVAVIAGQAVEKGQVLVELE